MFDNIRVISGSPYPLGLSIQGDTANFSLFSSHAEKVVLGLLWDGKRKEVAMEKTGDVWHIGIEGIPEGARYAYKCFGPKKLLFHPELWLADPYAKLPVDYEWTRVELPKPFDWEGVLPPEIGMDELIIYEMHVRGFTRHSSSQVAHPGTYLGMIEKIPYLKKLGVNAVELLPIYDFDRHHGKKEPLVNYWGYNTIHFFAPQPWYAVSDPVAEFKTLVRELHRNGILVLLDVVYNHTGEGREEESTYNFRGIDDPVYYQLDENGHYRNYTGCGNTFNTNHPVVRKFILDSLHYWAGEMRVDGFRFDLASIFSRDVNGHPMANPPIIREIMEDPILSQKKLIAEAWDAAGLYQLGFFANKGRWSEWNGQYRDIVRRFIKGTEGNAGDFARVLSGSQMIYHESKTPLSSINFITCHDGFCLRDLVTYQHKYNLANGENNQDGNNQNDNWNCGHEGVTDDPKINALREKQMRNFFLALFISQGVPMLLMGDEYGHTRHGNNNPYVLDNEINWFLWDQENEKIFSFVAALIRFRKSTHNSDTLPFSLTRM